MKPSDILKTSLPTGSFLEQALPRIDYADAYRGGIHTAAPIGLDDLFKAFFLASPFWVTLLLRLRNRLVGILGLKTGQNDMILDIGAFQVEKGNSLGLFKVLEKSNRELVTGKDDKHLDFRVSFFLDPQSSSAKYTYAFTLSTVVMFHNRFGRLYFAVVKPFHGLIVPAMMRSISSRLH